MTKNNIKTIRTPVCALLILLASTYLTFIVDVYTLNTWAKKIFVFLYFCGMCTLAAWLKAKYIGQSTKKTLITSLLLAFLLLFTFQGSFIPDWESQQVILRANVSEEYPTGEIWLTGIESDGEFIEASALNNVSINNWIYNYENDDYVFYPGEAPLENSLCFYTPAKDFTLCFASNPWSGSVMIEEDGETEMLTLYAEEENSEPLRYELKETVERPVAEKLLLSMGVLVVLSFLLSIGLSRLNITKVPKNAVLTGVYLLAGIVLFGTSPLIAPSRVTKVLLVVLSLGVVLLRNVGDIRLMEKYQSRGMRFFSALIAVYASLASFGYRFFLYGDTRPTFSVTGVVYCILGVIWFLPLIQAMLYLLERLTQKGKDCTRSPAQKKRAFWVLLVVLMLCQSVSLLAFWPGGFPSDCTDQICQAIGLYGINAGHPVIHTLLYRVILMLFHVAGAITAVQMICFVILVTLILKEGYERGVGLLPLCVGGGVFLLLPNQVFSSVLATKDYPYSLALLWSTWLIFRLMHQDGECNLLFYVALSLNSFLVCTLRHNGIVPYLALVLFLLYSAFRKKKKCKQLIAAVLASLMLLIVYNGPLFRVLKVGKSNFMGYTVMLCAVGSCVNKNLPLSENTNEIMAKVMPMEDWEKYYGRFVGHDLYMWGGGSGVNLTEITGREVFIAYFDALFHYPDVVIKDRLDGTNLLWCVAQPTDAYNVKSFDFVDTQVARFDNLFDYSKLSEESTACYNRSRLAEFYRRFLRTQPNQALDMLLWRTGAYLILLWVLLLYWLANQRLDLLFCSVPLLGNLAGLLLVLYHQSFRYVYAVQLLVIVLLLFTLISPMKHNTEEI